MAIAQLLRPFNKTLAILCLLTLVTACGGGGGSKDTTPNTFSFPTVNGAAVDAPVTSAPITVAGINKDTAISVSAGSTYSIDGAAATATPGTVKSGQTVTVSLLAASAPNTAKTATLTIGGVAGVFTVNTIDTVPAAITFPAVNDVAFASDNESTPVTITGIDVPVPISISAGSQYKINNGVFTSAPGTISANDVIIVKVAAANTYNTPALATVTIADVATSFTVTTLKDTVPPLATVIFPTPVSMTTAPTLKIRGTASDAGTGVASVMVAGVAAEPTTAGYATWVAEVPLLQATTNLLAIVTTDGAGNTKTDQISVKRVERIYRALTPLHDDIIAMEYANSVALDLERNRLLVVGNLNSGSNIMAEIFAADLTTSVKTPLFSLPTPNDDSTPTAWTAMLMDDANQKIILFDSRANQFKSLGFNAGVIATTPTIEATVSARIRQAALDSLGKKIFMTIEPDSNAVAPLIGNAIHVMDLETGIESTLPDNTNSPSLPLTDIYGLAINAENTIGWVVDRATNVVVKVDLVSGERTILSPAQQAINFSDSRAIQIDEANARLLIPSAYVLYAVDLRTGVRTSITKATSVYLSIGRTMALALDSAHNRLFMANISTDSITAVDLITGDFVDVVK